MNKDKTQEFSPEILNPSCSEQVFKLSGSLEEIRQKVLKMLDVCKENGNGTKKEINELKGRINKIENLEDFELIVFEFTGYETYFKKKKNDLLVGTSKNQDWDEVGIDSYVGNSEDDECDEYSKISESEYYKVLFKDRKYIVATEEYSDKLNLIFLEAGQIILKDDMIFKITKKKSGIYIVNNNQLVKVKEIKDENLKNKLGILANLK